MTDLVEISSAGLTAKINPLGAELWSLTDQQGREYMTSADPAFWSGHAPILFPNVGELAGGTYRIGGKEYALARHGFARRNPFELVEHRGHLARFRLRDSEQTRAVYPFAFELELAFRLAGMRLEVEALVRNTGTGDLPFSLGFHPGFAWPLPGGGDKLAHAIRFQSDEPLDIWRLDADGLVSDGEASPVRGKLLALDPALFERDAMIWDELRSTWVEYAGGAGAPSLRVDCPDLPYLGLWQKPGADFICIEPWHGLADDAGYAGDFREKRGVIVLPPAQVRSFRMDVTVTPAKETQP